MTKPNHSKPFPVKLGDELKPFLQQEVQSGNHKSLHGLIKKILCTYKQDEREEFLKNSQAGYS